MHLSQHILHPYTEGLGDTRRSQVLLLEPGDVACAPTRPQQATRGSPNRIFRTGPGLLS
jgi:hypothetical protein